MLMSASAYAKLRGVAKRTIQHAISTGLVILSQDGKVDSDQADASWWQAHQARMKGQGVRPTSRIVRAKVVAGAAKVQLASHRFGQMEATVIDKATVIADAEEQAGVLLAALRRLPEEAEALATQLQCSTETAAALLARLADSILHDLGDPVAEVRAAVERLA